MRKAGSAESEEEGRTERMKKAEDELVRANNGIEERRDAVKETHRNYDDWNSSIWFNKESEVCHVFNAFLFFNQFLFLSCSPIRF